MPIYEYKCKSCGEIHEALQRFSDPPLKTCPKCGGELVKLISAQIGLHFNGSGFYITDYARNNGGKKEGKKSETSKSTSESTSES